MKTFSNANARDPKHAVALSQQARRDGRAVSFAGAGSDLLALVKDRIVEPDVLINLRTMKGFDRIAPEGGGLKIGGLVALDTLTMHPAIRRDYAVLADAAASVATPQIRNVGTVAGNLCQRPWCWYFRNGFHCYKAGGNQCFSITGENQFHAIFGGGPSFIVHPSDTAPAMVALDAVFHIVGPSGERTVPAGEFFTLPKQDAARENVLKDDEILTAIQLPAPRPGMRSVYHKAFDRESWTHAVASVVVVLEMDGDVCRSARVVLGGVAPIPWRVPQAERLLAGQRVTSELAARVGESAIAGATPLRKNGYKVQLTRTIVERSVSELAAKA